MLAGSVILSREAQAMHIFSLAQMLYTNEVASRSGCKPERPCVTLILGSDLEISDQDLGSSDLDLIDDFPAC